MTEEDVRERLKKKFARRGEQFAWAERHGISQAYVSEFVNGKRGIGPQILTAMGLETVYRHTRKSSCDQAGKGA